MDGLKDLLLLLVEDNRDDIFFLSRAFLRRGHHLPVRVVHDGEQAVAYLSGSGSYADRQLHPMPTHVLLDLKLPKKSGLEVLEWMKSNAETRRLPAAMLSSSGQSEDVNRARDLGCSVYWTKPVSYDGLSDLADRIVAWMKGSEPN